MYTSTVHAFQWQYLKIEMTGLVACFVYQHGSMDIVGEMSDCTRALLLVTSMDDFHESLKHSEHQINELGVLRSDL